MRELTKTKTDVVTVTMRVHEAAKLGAFNVTQANILWRRDASYTLKRVDMSGTKK